MSPRQFLLTEKLAGAAVRRSITSASLVWLYVEQVSQRAFDGALGGYMVVPLIVKHLAADCTKHLNAHKPPIRRRLRNVLTRTLCMLVSPPKSAVTEVL